MKKNQNELTYKNKIRSTKENLYRETEAYDAKFALYKTGSILPIDIYKYNLYNYKLYFL
ncbi:hypothetical protein HBE96_18955 [Clostridium sp. P21]|uniref:Uncharacterized protein n=1 Tax=Clostridium muellerianum TaxID=2716538 RepID=A0A7Y0ELP9_9CLOT|nr:hypothetical protein [Clostridium muellerianum]NMM64690.1 hypothetical protein [Clostridium muellerianum]